jgi:sugar/nucleoside kinase (ribokinase family)
MCIQYKVPYVTVDTGPEDPLGQNADVLIISGEYRDRHFQGMSKIDALNQYIQTCKGTIIFTSAEDDILYNKDREILQFKPYAVNAIDTTGAGDSFRAGIIYGMLNAYPLDQTVAFASLLASYICQSFPGVIKAPTHQELIAFSKRYVDDYIKSFK